MEIVFNFRLVIFVLAVLSFWFIRLLGHNIYGLLFPAGVQNMKGQYLFNLPTFSTTVHAVGTIIKFVREGQFYAEEITIPGPITEPIKIVVSVP